MQASLRHVGCGSLTAACPIRAPPCRASKQSEMEPVTSNRTQPWTRRCAMGGIAAVVTLANIAMQAPVASAFGSGFPGYDVNLDGRKRALERNKREMEADRQRAAEWRATRDAAKEKEREQAK